MERSRQPQLEHRRPVTARPPTGSRPRGDGPRIGPVRITPTRVVLLVALVGSLAYLAFAITVRDASQIPMLSSGAAVLGIVFGALAVLGAVSTYRAGVDGRNGQAFTLAVLGGVAAMIAAGCFAAAIVLGLVLQV
jgi:hypothetical protein